jgi:large subunit ribosomal protein L32e
MKREKFLRRDTVRFSKLGKNRKKLQKWRKPKGRDNKMREKQRGYPKNPNIGYKKPSTTKPTLVYNTQNLEKLEKSTQVILAKVGAKRKLELIKKASDLKLNVLNIGAKK